MLTRLCPFLLANRRRPQGRNTPEQCSGAGAGARRQLPGHGQSTGQVLVIFAVSLLALIFFVGLAIDAGSMYITYGQLKRAVDAAAVAASNDFKKGASVAQMSDSAKQVLLLHNVDLTSTTLAVYICDANGDGIRDTSLQTTVPEFYARCPDTSSPANESPRKLVWVEAKLHAPFYFLSLMGFYGVDLKTNSIAEAAPVDVVLVLDVSESMGVDTPGYVVDDFDPNNGATACNPNLADPNSEGTCQPLNKAKDAAIALVNTLYNGYDRVSIVTLDQVAYANPIVNSKGVSTDLSDDLNNVKIAIRHVKLHDDPPYSRLWSNWRNPGRTNLANPEDRDGDGADFDDPTKLGYTCPAFPADDGSLVPNPDPLKHILDDRWWSTDEGAPDPYGWGGVPCDRNDKLDAYDWNKDGRWTQSDADASATWLANNNPSGLAITLSPLSTCSGCGIRVGANVLASHGRPNAVWVMIYLSDGAVNLSDTHVNAGQVNGTDVIPTWFPNGFCTGKLFGPCNSSAKGSTTNPDGYWCHACQDLSRNPRYCIDHTSATCPPDDTHHIPNIPTIWIGDTWNPYQLVKQYSVYDYAMDMIDQAALIKSDKRTEPRGNDIAIYSVGMGAASTGADLLRYMAAVGDDGDRTTDPCNTIIFNGFPTKSCGQYYFAQTADDLLPIFEDIASRIYTRISE